MRRIVAAGFFAVFFTTFFLIFAVSVPAIDLQNNELPEVTTLNCSVEEIKFYAPSWGPVRGTFRGMHYEVALKISSDTDIQTVFLGPAMYIDRQPVKIARYDSLEIKGYRKVYDGKSVMIAQEVSKSGHVLKLRDLDGTPLWAGPKASTASY